MAFCPNSSGFSKNNAEMGKKDIIRQAPKQRYVDSVVKNYQHTLCIQFFLKNSHIFSANTTRYSQPSNSSASVLLS